MTKPGKDDALLMSNASETEAEMLRGLLDAEGIPCLQYHRGLENQPDGIGLGAPPLADVYVPHDARKRAVEVVSAAWPDFVPEPQPE